MCFRIEIYRYTLYMMPAIQVFLEILLNIPAFFCLFFSEVVWILILLFLIKLSQGLSTILCFFLLESQFFTVLFFQSYLLLTRIF